MGNYIAWVRTVTDEPGVNPGPNATPSFDPMFGFANGRKPRGMHNLFEVIVYDGLT